MSNVFAILLSVLLDAPTTNQPSWLESGAFAGWWDKSICQQVELSWPATNGTYRVQWQQEGSPTWLYVTPLLNAAETNQVVVRVSTPRMVGYFRAVKQQ